MCEQDTALRTGSMPSRCRGTVDWVLMKRSILTERRNVLCFFFFFFFCNFGDVSPKAGLALPSTATLQRLHRGVQNPFKSIAIKVPMVLLFSFLLLFL